MVARQPLPPVARLSLDSICRARRDWATIVRPSQGGMTSMRTRTPRSLVTALSMTLALVWGGTASAQQEKCLAGKARCMAKKAAGLLKGVQIAETPGETADPTGATKVRDKFDTPDDPTKGCFEKLENKKDSVCMTLDDTGAAETAV